MSLVDADYEIVYGCSLDSYVILADCCHMIISLSCLLISALFLLVSFVMFCYLCYIGCVRREKHPCFTLIYFSNFIISHLLKSHESSFYWNRLHCCDLFFWCMSLSFNLRRLSSRLMCSVVVWEDFSIESSDDSCYWRLKLLRLCSRHMLHAQFVSWWHAGCSFGMLTCMSLQCMHVW